MRNTLFALATALTLSACASVPAATRAALERVDVLEADVASLRFVVEQPADRPLEVIANLAFGVETPQGTRSGIFPLEPTQKPAVTARISSQIFAIPPDEQVRFRSLQSEIRALKALHGTAARGVMSIEAAGCRRDPLGDGPVPISVSLALTPEAPLLPLLVDEDITRLSADAAQAGADRCPD